MSRVTVEITDHVATVTLNRPDKLNAFDMDQIDAVIAAGDTVAQSDARAVVLCGAGRGFSAGLDVMAFGALAAKQGAPEFIARSHGDCNRFQQVAMVWHDLPVPVIAAVHGVCFGAGLQCALGADIRIAAPDARLSVMEMKWGLIPDMGGMVLLPQLVRGDVMRRLIYTHDEVLGEEAQTLGLVTQTDSDPKAAAMALARQIAGKSPSAIRAAKRLAKLAETAPRAEVLQRESDEQAALIGAPDMLEAIAANLQKRVPRFE